jgi:hypothetical protein
LSDSLIALKQAKGKIPVLFTDNFVHVCGVWCNTITDAVMGFRVHSA